MLDLIWWFIVGRLFCGFGSWFMAMRAIRGFRDAKVARLMTGQNGMEMFTLNVVIFLSWFVAISGFLTGLNAAVVLPDIASLTVTTRRLWGSGILFVWSALCFGSALALLFVMPVLRRMAREQEHS